MKNIKKICLLFTLVLVLVSISGCGKKVESNIEGKLEEIMEKLYADIPDENKPMMLGNIEVNDENIESFIGTNDVEYKEALASESMIGSIAHSVVLVRTKEGADVEKIKSEIKEKIDPRKWICVGIERDEVVVTSRGDLILVVVVQDEENRTKIETAFKNL